MEIKTARGGRPIRKWRPRLRWQVASDMLGNLCKEALEEMAVSGRLSDKLKSVRTMTGEITAAIEERADKFLARRGKIEAQTEKSFSPHETILDMAEADLKAVEEELRQLGNDPLPVSVKPGES